MAPPVASVIAIDAMGGDNAPGPEVMGAVAAVREHGSRVILLGDEPRLRAELDKLGASSVGIPIRHCSEVITMDDHPGQAVRKKRQSSMRIGFELVRSGEAKAIVSAGNSGAMLACGLFVLGRMRGLDRPGIAVTMPTLEPGLFGAGPTIGQCVLLDTGANVDVKPQTLAQFAVLGAQFAKLRATSPRPRPRVGLLSNGEEASKGTALLREAHALLTAHPSAAFEYVGYVEGRDLFQYRRPKGHELREGGLDVVVTDGFTGNVVLKTAEGAGRFLADLLRSGVERSPVAKLGALLMMPALKLLRSVVDVDARGGAPLLGVNGVAIICHGRASARAIARAVQVAEDHVQSGLIEATQAAVIAHRFADGSASTDPKASQPEAE